MLKQVCNLDRTVMYRQGVDVDKIYVFLTRINNEYNPPLDTKVELRQYAEKIFDSAILFVEIGNETDIVGMVVLYCNDENAKKAYIPLVGVLPTYQHRGIASKLMKEAVSFVREQGYKLIGIHSNNLVAVNIYSKLGFIVKDDSERKYMELYI